MSEKKALEKILAIESILIELSLREGWSSRVQAERIYEVVTSKKAGKGIKKPWEHMAITLPEDSINLHERD